MDAIATTDEEQDSVPMYKLALIGDSGEAGHAVDRTLFDLLTKSDAMR